MKIIEILNKIANGVNIPIEINYKDITYRYDCDTKDYYSGLNDEYLLDSYSIPTILNDEVKILDEPKEIDKYKCQTSQIPPWFRNEELIRVINENFELHTKVIRELIDKVNKLKEK